MNLAPQGNITVIVLLAAVALLVVGALKGRYGK
jgi:hypothetical protein